MELDNTQRTRYLAMFQGLQVSPESLDAALGIATRIHTDRTRYQRVALALKFPWELVGIIHSLESDLNFNTHLHNGDPLFDAEGHPLATVHDPAGQGPFRSWEDSAVDALKDAKEGLVLDLRLRRADEWLWFLERYNGFGYRFWGPESPYLWSGSQHYTTGKFVEDGRFDIDAKSDQIGGAVLMWAMGLRNLMDSPLVLGKPPVITRTSPKGVIMSLQHFLNDSGDDYGSLILDGVAGPKTQERFKAVFGAELY